MRIEKMTLGTKRALYQMRTVLPFSFLLCATPVLAEDMRLNNEGEVYKIEQQKNTKTTVKGVVYDGMTKEPIIGGTVKLKGQDTGTVTNMNGEFTINCQVNDVLVISYIGYDSKELTVSNLKMYAVELYESTAQLGEVVVTAFGAGQKKASMVGSVEQIKPAELQIPSSSLSSAFAGRMAGVIAVQRSGEPGADGADFWIRGKSTFSGATGALIVIDGVEASGSELNRLDPEAIESFSILKDATATALYGTRGANGVMIVTTKSGENLEKPVINFRLETAVSQMSDVAEMVDGVTYMNMYNEAASRPGSSATPYSWEKIAGTIAGKNPYIYPNVDWYNEMFKKNSYAQRFNFNVRGGNKKMDYFMSGSFRHSDGNLRSISKDYFSYNNNINYFNYEFVNNLNVKVTPTTKIGLGLNLSIRDWKGPEKSTNVIFGLSQISNPVDFPIMYPAGMYANYNGVLWGDKPGGPYEDGYRNPVAEYVTGYKKQFDTTVTANFKLEQKLDMLLKGLRFSGLFSFKNWSQSVNKQTSKYNKFAITDYDRETMEFALKRVNGTENSTQLNYDKSATGDRKLYLQAMLEYQHTFNDVHDLNVMFLYNQNQYNVLEPSTLLESLPKRKQGIAGRASYMYDGKYLAEMNFGYNGSENFAKNKRFGFFPSFALGYNISEEKFWDNIRPYVSKLKLRASWGLVGNDDTGAGRFAYLSDITLAGSPYDYTFGVNQNKTYKGPLWKRYQNNEMTWETGEKWNIGMDMQFFNALNLNVDIFKETRSDIFMSRTGSIPQYSGLTRATIYANTGKMENKGIEFSLDYNKQINKDLFVSFKGTFTYAHNTVLEQDEPSFLEYPWKSKVGHSVDMLMGWVSNGLFPDEESIKNAPNQGKGLPVLPGDIWYLDQPNVYGEKDGIIDNNDKVYMGYPTNPEIIYGFGPSIKWKNWDCSFFFQGAARVSLMMSGIHPFGNTTLTNVRQFIADDYWSEANPNPNAKYPRLSVESNSHNTEYSDYWLRNAAFLKLKNAELGYTFKNMRFYLSGSNLLTFSPFKEWDPEMGGGNGLKYPTQRVFNLGFQMTFK